MCGRLTLHTPVLDWLMEFFPAYGEIWQGEIGQGEFWPQRIAAMAQKLPGIFEPRYNIAPTQAVLAVRQFQADAEPRLEAIRWGLVPPWADSLKIAYSLINARAETIEEKPTYKPLLAQGRCVLLADGYYEWKQIENPNAKPSKQTYWIHRPETQPLALACLWTSNHKALDGQPSHEPLLSTTIITTQAGPDTAPVHDRMPVVLADHTALARWLSSHADWESVKDLVCPAQPGTLQTTRVTSKVNSVRNQGPELIAPEPLDV